MVEATNTTPLLDDQERLAAEEKAKQLQAFSLSQLQSKALAEEISQQEVNVATDDQKPKAALIKLIVSDMQRKEQAQQAAQAKAEAAKLAREEAKAKAEAELELFKIV